MAYTLLGGGIFANIRPEDLQFLPYFMDFFAVLLTRSPEPESDERMVGKSVTPERENQRVTVMARS